MALLCEELQAFLTVGEEELRFVFREPTPKEENKFAGEKTSAKRNRVRDNSFSARIALFDLLFEKVENLTDPKAGVLVGPEKKPLDKTTLGLLPNRYKADLILFAYEATGAAKEQDADDKAAEEKEPEGKKVKN